MEMMAAASALQAHHPPPCFFPPFSSCHNNTRVCGRVLGLGSTPRLLRLRIRTRTTRIRILYVRAAANKDSSLGEDYVSRLLRERPSQVEPKYLIGDELYTLREKQRLETPLWKRAVETVQSQFAKVGSETPSQPEDEIPVPSKRSDANERDKQVYLSDLLREYRGNLYVPEEAFSGHVSELEEFNRLLDVLPEMTFESFLKATNAQQVEMLTSRGHASPRGEFVYYDFIVDLKSIPGEQHLQRRHWAMHLTEPEAQTVLSKYTGPQHEVETYFTPYVEPPPATPHPAASSISGRVVLELSVVASLVGAAAFAVGGMASVLLFTLTGTLSVLLLRVLWPLAAPLVNPVLGLVLDIARATGNVILGVLSGGAVGSKGLPALFSDGYRYLTSGALFSSARTLGAIIFVLVAMAALAKFTLTRRPKDFTKWDLWQAIEFGQSKPQARVEGTTGVGFADVAGIDDVVTELQELVSYLKDPERFNQMGTKPPHGVLLEGPPGCGKTLLAKAIAGEAGVPFYQMAGSEFVEVLVGVGAARIRDLFKRAKVNRPSVVFIDEIDALGAMRHGAAGEEGMDSYNAGAQERETTLNQLLIELDGFDTGKGVVFLGATNRMDMLDPALLRPGRFDRKIAIRPPRAKGRYEILKVHSKSVKLDDSVDLESYAKNLPGWSGAELAQLLQEAALVAVRHGGTVINRLDMDRALDRLTMGSERIGLQRRLPVHRRMATHETGLALTSHLLRRLEDAETEFCDRVSIVPRGETLARTIFDRLDDEAYLFERLPALLHRLQVMLGGRAAEEVMYGRDTSTFSLLHLPDASWLARKLVSVWNLEGGITITGDPNPWSREAVFTGPPLGFEGGLYDNYGFVERPLNYDLVQETTLRTKALLDNMYMKTLTLLKQHHAALTKAVYVVMEKEELFGEELDQIIDLYPLGTSVQVVEDEEEPGDLLPLPDDLEAGLDELRSSSELRERIVVPEDFGGDDDDQVSVLRQKTNGNGEARKQLLLEEALRREKEGSTLEGGDIAATTRTSTVYNDDAAAGNSQTPASVRTGDIDSNF